jgi:fructokinase
MQATEFIVFGEVLFDRFPDGLQVLGGAPFNVAWHLQAFGEFPLFVSRVGADRPGEEIRAAMQAWGMSLDGLQFDPEYPTGTVAVSFRDGQPEYAILDRQAYDFICPPTVSAVPAALLYHGSLAVRHEQSRLALTNLKSRLQATVFLDVNLRAPWWDLPLLESAMHEAAWLKLNIEELAELETGVQSVETKMQSMLQRYALSGIVVTLGEAGALALLADGTMARVKPESGLPVADTVGAGDAFAAVMLLGIRKAWPLLLTLQRAQYFAAAIVGQRGATVSDAGFYRQILAAWDADLPI